MSNVNFKTILVVDSHGNYQSNDDHYDDLEANERRVTLNFSLPEEFFDPVQIHIDIPMDKLAFKTGGNLVEAQIPIVSSTTITADDGTQIVIKGEETIMGHIVRKFKQVMSE